MKKPQRYLVTIGIVYEIPGGGGRQPSYPQHSKILKSTSKI